MKAVLFEIASIFFCAVAQTLNIHVQYSWTNQVGVDCIKDRGKATLFVPGFIITLGACATRGTVFLCWYSSVMLIIYSKLKNEKKWKTTNHSRASCFIRSRMTSRPHRLKKTSSMQSKRRDLHHTWLHRETNEKLSLFIVIHHDE